MGKTSQRNLNHKNARNIYCNIYTYLQIKQREWKEPALYLIAVRIAVLGRGRLKKSQKDDPEVNRTDRMDL